METMPRHQCIVYDGSPFFLLQSMAELIRTNIANGKRCLYFNSPSMVAGLRSSLPAFGIDAAAEVERGTLLLMSDQDHLVNNRFEPRKMLDLLKNLADQAVKDGFSGLWATGDMTWEFGNEENLTKLFEYECGLEAMFQSTPHLSGVCQYHRDTLPEGAIRDGLNSHRAICVNETLSRWNPFYVAPNEPREHVRPVSEMLRELQV